MKREIKVVVIVLELLFAWLYSSSIFCENNVCLKNRYIPVVITIAFLAIFNYIFLRFYPRFRAISQNGMLAIVILFPVILYIFGVILNSVSATTLAVIIIGAALLVLSLAAWFLAKSGRFSALMTEALVLKSLALLALGLVFLINNISFAVVSYLKYTDVTNDIYITENHGEKSSFLNYKIR